MNKILIWLKRMFGKEKKLTLTEPNIEKEENIKEVKVSNNDNLFFSNLNKFVEQESKEERKLLFKMFRNKEILGEKLTDKQKEWLTEMYKLEIERVQQSINKRKGNIVKYKEILRKKSS